MSIVNLPDNDDDVLRIGNKITLLNNTDKILVILKFKKFFESSLILNFNEPFLILYKLYIKK